MSNDYLEYQFEQAVGEQLKGILTAKDLANMVVTVKIEFKNKAETEEEKEAREKEEKRYTRASLKNEFRGKWDSGHKKRTTDLIETVPNDQRIAGSFKREGIVGPDLQKWQDKVKKDRADLWEEYFPGENEEDFLKK